MSGNLSAINTYGRYKKMLNTVSATTFSQVQLLVITTNLKSTTNRIAVYKT